jgi:hypothetical protein
MKVSSFWSGILLFLICFPGCNSTVERIKLGALKIKKEVNCSVNKEKRTSVRRILVFSVKNDTEIPQAGDETFKSLMLQLSKLNYFELLSWKDFREEDIKILEVLGNPSVPNAAQMEAIRKFGAAHQIDAVLFPEVKQYRSYRPLFFGYKQKMLQLSSGALLWMVDDVFDMSDPDVNMLAKNWYYHTQGEENNPSLKSSVMEVSMVYFVQFSLSSILETWLK